MLSSFWPLPEPGLHFKHCPISCGSQWLCLSHLDGRNQVLLDSFQSSNLFSDRSRQGLVSVHQYTFFVFFNSGPPCSRFSQLLTLLFISVSALSLTFRLTSGHRFCTYFLAISSQLSAVLLFHLACFCWTRYNCGYFVTLRSCLESREKW